MNETAIILRKDFRRIRNRCKEWIRTGTRRAQLEEQRKTDEVIEALLNNGITVWTWNGKNEEKTTQIIKAILKMWPGITIDEICWRFHHIIIVAALDFLIQQGDIQEKYDSYGRKKYYASVIH